MTKKFDKESKNMHNLSIVNRPVKTPKNSVTDDELSALLQEHNVWLQSAGEEGKRLVFSHSNLSGHDFYNTNLEKSIFNKCDLSDCNFFRAKLQHAALNGCNLQRANFSHVKFDYSSLSYSNLFYTDFHGANLRLADVTGTKLKGAHLFGTRLPANTWLILGEEYSIQITHGVTLSAGCQVHKIEHWRRFQRKEIESMDGERAIKFYPRLLDILDFYTGTGERPDWL